MSSIAGRRVGSTFTALTLAAALGVICPTTSAATHQSTTPHPSLPDSADVDFTGGVVPRASAYFTLERTLVSPQLTARKATFTNRYVALGDSVPYGHGLANPYTTPQIGTGSAVSQGPSPSAWPSLVNKALGDSMNVRQSNCALTGDQLSISGAQAAAMDAAIRPQTLSTAVNYQCPGANRSVQGTEISNDGLLSQPASLVTIQAGADDIDFGDCLAYVLTDHVLDHSCVVDGAPTAAVESDLANVESSLTSIIEKVSPDTRRVLVVDYYDPVPSPNDFDGSSSHSGVNVDPVCLGLQTNETEANIDGVVLTTALNQSILAAVDTAKAAGVTNVGFVDISNLELHHEMCTSSPALFSGEPMSDSSFAADLSTIGMCAALKLVLGPSEANGRTCVRAAADTIDIQRHSWRTAHPNQVGQRDIANAVLESLNG
ncbi:MAG: SGNH/GDSL hydrolase family protein [Acidimicrobiales bacterium]